MRTRIFALALLPGVWFSGESLWGQLIPNGSPIPHTGKPPVVFLNGYQQDCSSSTFASTFGIADQVLQSNGEASVFFDNCSVAGHPPIEDEATAFATFLAGLRYDDGQPVTTVDTVVHSMGGLIVRSYLSGKQKNAATFQPPAATMIRKIVFLSTPHFGTDLGASSLAGLLLGSDDQVTELASGSQFVFDLGTWNQGTDDLRGSDALALIGNGGTGDSFLIPIFETPGFDDGVVALSSASIGFVYPGRTRVLPFCHIPGGGVITLAGLCSADAKGMANIQSATDPQAVAIVSFLNGATDWMSIGTAAENDPFLSKNGGLDVETRSSGDLVLPMDSATATPASGSPVNLSLTIKNAGYANLVPAGPVALKTVSGSVTTAGNLTLAAGAYTPVVLKTGPIIGRVYPAASVVFPLSVAPGQFVAIYGSALAGSTATAQSANYPTQLAGVQAMVNGSPIQLYFVSSAQIDAIIPDNATGLVKLTVQNSSGSNSVNVLVEAAVPAIFTQNGSGSGPASALNASNASSLVTASNPLRAGDYVSLFLTGLGATTNRDGLDWANQQPTVTIAGRPCAVSYAGRAPGFQGLDQINCQVPTGLTADPAAQIIVYSGSRGSNVATVAVQ
jgi:uncharacterized protein (TIGR03437 family)